MAINNGVNTVSRIVMGFIADKVGRQNTLVLSVLGSALTVVTFWLASALKNDGKLWLAFVVTYGVFAGGQSSVLGKTASYTDNRRIQFALPDHSHGGVRVRLDLVTLTQSLRRGSSLLTGICKTRTQAYASVNGFIYFVRGVGALWGSPIGGLLVGNGPVLPKAYMTLICYDFGLLLFASVCVIGVRALDAAEKGQFKLKA